MKINHYKVWELYEWHKLNALNQQWADRKILEQLGNKKANGKPKQKGERRPAIPPATIASLRIQTQKNNSEGNRAE